MSLCIQLVSPLVLLVKAEPPIQMEADDMRVPLTLMTLPVAGRSAWELIIPSFVLSPRAYGPAVRSSCRSRLRRARACRGAARPAGAAAAAVRQGGDAFARLQRVSSPPRKAVNQFGGKYCSCFCFHVGYACFSLVV